MRKVVEMVAALCLVVLGVPAWAQLNQYPAEFYRTTVESPAQFLGYEPGAQFTPHHKIVDYAHYLAKNSERVQLQTYGQSYERRPLLCLFISTPKNLEKLPQIEAALASLRKVKPNADLAQIYHETPAVVWLSYGVHGNEPSSAEAALQVAYQLAAGTDSTTRKILKNLVVIIDPLLNPDGRERYVNGYRSAVGPEPNPDPQSAEHFESWPGGRTNHYYIDLNRDWAWATQQETRARLQLYRKWYPQVHVDFHEMSYESTYFFFPPQGPMLQILPAETRDWMSRFGRMIAKAFDHYGWAYYSAEDFDLFYPGYGDSWPTLNGAIGMTFEQAGHARAGLVVTRKDGTHLTLADRIRHHFVSSMATLKTTAQFKEKRLRDYRHFWVSGQEQAQKLPFRGYAVIAGTAKGRFRDFLQTLLRQGIALQRVEHAVQIKNARDLLTDAPQKITLAPGDYFIPLVQENTRLLQVLFEPRPALSDTFFYDITAWSLPVAYGVRAFKLAKAPTGLSEVAHAIADDSSAVLPAPGYAYIIPWSDLASFGLVSDLLEKGVRVYVAKKGFALNGRLFHAGDTVVPVHANGVAQKLHAQVTRLAAKWHVEWVGVNTGYTEDGIDLGSNNVAWLRQPKIAVLMHEPVNSNSYGAIWHILEQQAETPFSALRTGAFKNSKLSRYNVLVFPDAFASYSMFFDSIAVQKLKAWIREGGVAIGLGKGAEFFIGAKLSANRIKSAKKTKKDSVQAKIKQQESERRIRMTWKEKQEERMRSRVPGAIFRIRLDRTHPLGYGHDSEGFIIKRNKLAFVLSDKVHNVGIIGKNAHVAGFLNHDNTKLLQDSAVMTVERMGRGKIILFAYDPNFRLFWRNATGLFLNALLFGSVM